MQQLRSAGGIEYLLTRKRVKNFNLRIGRDAKVAVSAPMRADAREIDAFVAQKAQWIEKAQQSLAAAAQRAQPLLPDAQQCLELFEEISDAVYPLFAGYLNGQKPAIAVRSMKSRWGSCHIAKHKITLARQLALMPRAAVEYVVVHEYCHFVHANHQKAFWVLVGSIMPDYKARRALLKLPPSENEIDRG